MAKACIWVLWMLAAIEAKLKADVESRPGPKPVSPDPESADWLVWATEGSDRGRGLNE